MLIFNPSSIAKMQASKQPCKFFLQGHCRFGANCWNQHPQQSQQNQGNRFGNTIGGQTSLFGQNKNASFSSYNANRNMFSALGSKPANAFSAKQNPNAAGGAKDDPASIIQLISKEMQTWSPSKMWPLSCFGYAREQPCFSGLTDYSPEELRIEAYNAKANNTLQQYISGITQLGAAASQRKNELRSLTQMTLKNELQKAAQESPFGPQQTQTTSLFGNQLSTTNNIGVGNPFGKQSQSANANPFASASNPSPFGGTSTSNNLFKPSALAQNSTSGFGSVFGNPAPQPQAASPFGTQATSVFGGKPTLSSNAPAFGSSLVQQSNALSQGGLFGNSQSNVFGSSNSTLSAQNPFKTAQAGLFGNAQSQSTTQQQPTSVPPPANPFLAASQQSQPTQQTPLVNLGQLVGILSHISFELTADDITAFKSDAFTLGSIPERPPTLELC